MASPHGRSPTSRSSRNNKPPSGKIQPRSSPARSPKQLEKPSIKRKKRKQARPSTTPSARSWASSTVSRPNLSPKQRLALEPPSALSSFSELTRLQSPPSASHPRQPTLPP